MPREPIDQAWIQRCAQRIRIRHLIADDEAMELASALHTALEGMGCPERAADELFVPRQPARPSAGFLAA